MTTLITGATGFLGPHVVWEAAAHGAVVAADLAPPEQTVRAFLARDQSRAVRVTWVTADVTDYNDLCDAARGHRITHLIHAAAVTPDTTAEAVGMRETIAINVLGTAHALDLARTLGVERTIVFSSSAVYAANDGTPLIEESAWRDTGSYVVSKQSVERLAAFAAAGYGMDVVAVRPAALFGPLERPTHARQAMSSIYDLMQMALNGDEIRVPHDALIRDWTAASEVAHAVIALLHAPVLTHRVYNVGAGRGYAIEEVLAALMSAIPSVRWRFTSPEEANVTFGIGMRRGPLAITRLLAVPDADIRSDLAILLSEYCDWLGHHPY